MAESFRCSAASRERGDRLAGTASTVAAFLLVEHPGPWGMEALRDARLPEGLGPRLAAASRRTGVRVLLARRPGRRSPDRRGVRVLAARSCGPTPRLLTGLLADLAEVGDLDLADLVAGGSAGLALHDRPVLAVCTHGRHDACCAERGRPIAAALAAGAGPGTQVWECSHIGGDRFAGNLLVLPHGLYYGGLDVPTALEVARATAEGRLLLPQLRGRSCLPMPAQVAEIALRERLGRTELAPLRLGGHRVDGAVTTVRFDLAGEQYAVSVRTDTGPVRHLLTCRAARPSTVPSYQVVDVERL